MAQDDSQLDTDGYYGDEDMDSEEIDLSFLDQNESDDTSADNEDKKSGSNS